MFTVDKIIVDLCGSLYNKYLEQGHEKKSLAASSAKKAQIHQTQGEQFIQMMPVITAVLESQLLQLEKPKKKAVTLFMLVNPVPVKVTANTFVLIVCTAE